MSQYLLINTTKTLLITTGAACILLLFTACSCPDNEGSGASSSLRSYGVNNCHDTPNYLIVEAGDGRGFIAKPQSEGNKASCDASVGLSDIEIRTESYATFLSIADDQLTFDTGTAPTPRNLHIWDLNHKRELHSKSVYNVIEIMADEIIYLAITDIEPDDTLCPDREEEQAMGFQHGIGEVIVLKLPQLTKNKTGELACVLMQ